MKASARNRARLALGERSVALAFVRCTAIDALTAARQLAGMGDPAARRAAALAELEALRLLRAAEDDSEEGRRRA